MKIPARQYCSWKCGSLYKEIASLKMKTITVLPSRIRIFPYLTAKIFLVYFVRENRIIVKEKLLFTSTSTLFRTFVLFLRPHVVTLNFVVQYWRKTPINSINIELIRIFAILCFDFWWKLYTILNPRFGKLIVKFVMVSEKTENLLYS